MLPCSAASSTPGWLTVAYLTAAVLFILSLGGLSNQESARKGNLYGMVGMGIALVATLAWLSPDTYSVIATAVIAGTVIGAFLASRVAMTAMPELVAALHSFVGLAAVLVGLSLYVGDGSLSGTEKIVHDIEVFVDVAIGALTFTGSVVAWAKLAGKLSGSPLLLPGRHFLNLAMVVALVVLGTLMVTTPDSGFNWLLLNAVIAGVLGIHLVLAIGGADMPVVVSLLNSYSGWTAAAAGFMLGNDLLIVTGALVGSSGAILSYIMCKAMNRSIWNVVFGGFGTEAPAPSSAPAPSGDVVAIEVEELAAAIGAATDIIVVPGYGMAVAQAQHKVREFGQYLRDQGKNVRYAIHPVAGRLPGHMNVLLAEAGVPYDVVLEMDEINADFPKTGVVLVIGANDIVNPGALDDPGSPIYGMPVLEAWNAETVVVLKRSMNVGYAGVANPLFFKENTRMFFGDAAESMTNLCTAVRAE
ncbi:MAG: NAD(P)(+) transhydrogenase (Re/Si-specific) subunit beta [Myxococcota bacterium]|nr:NAD(P)(+) transhydrogenase (Re/Si-specific) subunit beta [Myxococcota bacterium]